MVEPVADPQSRPLQHDGEEKQGAATAPCWSSKGDLFGQRLSSGGRGTFDPEERRTLCFIAARADEFADKLDEELAFDTVGLQGLASTRQVDDCVSYPKRVFAEMSDPHVAPETQQPAYSPGLVVVVYVQGPARPRCASAESTPTTLCVQERLVIRAGEVEDPSEVALAELLRVISPILALILVMALRVGLPPPLDVSDGALLVLLVPGPMPSEFTCLALTPKPVPGASRSVELADRLDVTALLAAPHPS
jgi:hypothetical protein